MQKIFKTKELSDAYQVLGAAKYQKLSDEDKVKVWKVSRQLKPVATKFMEDVQDAQEKLVPSEDYYVKLEQARKYEQAKKKGEGELPMSDDEYQKFIEDYSKYNKLVDEAVNDLANKEVTVDIELFSEESFGQLMSSNDWNMHQVMLVGEVFGL